MINRYNINIRKYHSTDIKNITRLFYDTVHAINAKDYTKNNLMPGQERILMKKFGMIL